MAFSLTYYKIDSYSLGLLAHHFVHFVLQSSQGYLENDLGKLKVEVTAELCGKINTTAEILTLLERLCRSMDVGNTVFCAVEQPFYRTCFCSAWVG